MRTSIFAALTILLLATAAQAQGPHKDIDQAPPAEPVYEIKPGDRAGYYLAPGYWRWDGKRHIWTPSRWIADRPGHTWVPDSWEQHGAKWHFAKGYWLDPSTGEEAAEAEEAAVVAKAATSDKPKVKKAKRPRKPDYSNNRVWPKISHH